MMNATQEQAMATTSVFWDIKTYPVPRGCDAGVVGRFINRYLWNLGYSGPLVIFAVGLLTDVSDDVLRVLSSTGIIALNHVPLGSIGILRGMNKWKETVPPPANMMLISTDESILPRIRHSSCGYNIFRLFPDKSCWLKFLLEDSGASKYSVTPEPAFWICSVCDDHGQGYEKFTTHLSSLEHKHEATRVDKEAVGLISVIWDIKGCPVPPDCDALRVRPCIKQYLKDFGYSGPLTITAIGRLTDINQDVMRAVFSSGINLEHGPFESGEILPAMYDPRLLDQCSANIMVICPYLEEVSAKVVGDLKSFGYNIIELFPYNSPYSESLWKTFLLEGTLEEEVDKCSETGEHAFWVCSECHPLSGRGFHNFITHLSSRGHEPPKPIEIVTDATVFWDIKGYPVPPGCDGHRVGLWIKQYLKDLNISGPFTLNAIGLLTDVPPKVLQAVSTTGIILKHGPFDSTDIMYQWTSLNPPPANMMVICPYSETLAKIVDDLEKLGYTIIVPLQYDSDCSESLWEEFLLHDSVTLVEEEDKCSETDASWVCSVCHDISGKGFEYFITHLSQKHGQKDLIQSRLLPETSSDEGTYLSIRQTMYQKAKEFESKIIGFEMAIRRPYFHVHPLNVAELENWHNYLDFIEIDGDLIKVVKLFERCVVACANYSEFWIRYVIKMKKSGMPELAESALARATQIFVKKQPAIHLFAARFKEENNDIAGARAAYQLVHSDIAPGLLEAVVKHANMERRQDNLEKACSLYEQMIAVEKLREHSAILPQLYAQYLRFLYLVSGDPEKARKIIVEALDHVPPSKPFLEELIQFETIQRATRQIDYLEPLVEKVINPDADNQNISSSTEREELSLIYIEFLSVFGDVESWIKAEDKHAKLFLPHRSS